MEEKIIIQTSEMKSWGWKLFLKIIGIVFVLIYIVVCIVEASFGWYTFWQVLLLALPFAAIFTLFSIPLIFLVRMLINEQLVVTNKRVYGKVAFGKRVDLPLDSVSAVSLTSWLFYGIAIFTSTGKIIFLWQKNRNEFYNAINKLLVERQDLHTTIKQEIPQSSADELKKYKQLLDDGIITQEEFDEKKKQLLNL